MQFSELILEKVILELRYDTAFLFWDNSGKVAAQIAGKYPSLELVNAQLSNVQWNWWDQGVTINFTHQKADVTQDFPSSLENFKGVCTALSAALSKCLEVSSYNRVGVRYIFAYPTKSKEAARDFVLSLGVVVLPPERLRPFGTVRIEEEQIMARFEDEDRGYSLRVSHAPRELALKVSRPIEFRTEKFHKDVVVFDMDCFTKKKVEASAFVPADFVRITFKTVDIGMLQLVGL